MRKGFVFCSMLVLMGTLDWLTTILGLAVFGATEANPLLAGITATSLIHFTSVKLAVVALVGLLFYKVGNAGNSGTKYQLGNRLPEFAYSLSLMFLTFVVVNNALTVVQLL